MYTMKLFVMKEFSACGPNAEKLCLNMMANIEADPENEWWYWLGAIFLFIFFRILALFILKEKASNFH